MIIQVYPNAKAVAQAAAMMIAAQITKKPDSVLGLGTGSTPIDTYQELIRLYQEKAVDFSNASTFNLDEYVHLPISHACSYHAFMQVQLFDHVNFKASFLPDSSAKDLNRESRRYDTAIRRRAAWTCSCLASATTATSALTSRRTTSAMAPGWSTSPTTIQANKRFSSLTGMSPGKPSPWASAPSWRRTRSCCWPWALKRGGRHQKNREGAGHPRLPASILRLHKGHSAAG